MQDIYLLIEGKQEGPYTEELTRQSLAEGLISSDLPAWHEGLSDWTEVRTIFDVASSGGNGQSVVDPTWIKEKSEFSKISEVDSRVSESCVPPNSALHKSDPTTVTPFELQSVPDHGAVFCSRCRTHVTSVRKYGVALAKAGASAFFMFFNGYRAGPLVRSAFREIPNDLKRRCPVCQSAI